MRIKIFGLFFVLISNICYSQNSFEKAYNKLVSVNKQTNEVEYLHFKIQTIPEYYQSNSKSILTDVYYSIKYREFGTSDNITWVKIYDGHLVNDLAKKYTQQWKGPYPGNRGISYKFFFELLSDSNQQSDKLNITIFSTNPELDFKYCNISNNLPFQVSAVYYNTENIKTALHLFSGTSVIHTVFELIESSNVATAIGTAIIDEVAINVVKEELKNLPIFITLKCNVCGKSETLKINDINYSGIFTCKTPGCHNTARIRLVE